MFAQAQFEALRFCRQQGQNIQSLSDSGEIFYLLEEHLMQLYLNTYLNREDIENIVAQATQEATMVMGHIIIDPMTNEQFRIHANRQNYERPSEIMKENLKALEGQRALEDDTDFFQKKFSSYVILAEDEDEMPVDSEAVLFIIYNNYYWNTVREELAEVPFPAEINDEYLQALFRNHFAEIARYNARWADEFAAGYQN